MYNMIKDNNSHPTLNIFTEKRKKNEICKANLSAELSNDKNYISKPKHYPPANKEWFNSIYSYNKNTSKLVPAADHAILKLVKSYFNFYSRKLEKRARLQRLRIRLRKLSTNRILVSKPEVKHTNDKVVITIYLYNRQKKYYLNKIKRIASIDQIDKLLPKKLKKSLIKNIKLWPSNLKMHILREKSVKIRSKLRKQKSMASFIFMQSVQNMGIKKMFKSYEVKHLKGYVTKSLRREIFSTYFKQLLYFNKSKFDERYLLPFTKLVKRIYNKEVVFNLVDLKYLYLNSYIFSNTLVTKLRNRKNRLLRVLRTSLLMFKLAPMDRIAVYDEIYHRKRRLQNLGVQDLTSHSLWPLQYSSTEQRAAEPAEQNNDVLDLLLSKRDPHAFLSKLKLYKPYLCNANSRTIRAKQKNSMFLNYPLYMTKTIINFIKHKYVSGIRLEVAGRLTRRNTAARSVFKLRYKGNIKNMDSSYKGLPTVLLRGYAKSNLQYTNLKSKIRIGSFGLKGWVSST